MIYDFKGEFGLNTANIAPAEQGALAAFYYNWGSFLRMQKEYEDAQQVYRRAIALNPKFIEAHNNLGDILYHLNRYEEAEQVFSNAINLESKVSDSKRLAVIYENLGSVLMAQQKNMEAEYAFHKAIQLDPHRVSPYNALGIFLYDLERFEESDQIFRKAVEVNPNSADAYYNLAYFLEDRERYIEAEVMYRKTLELNPEYVGARENLTELLKEQGREGDLAMAAAKVKHGGIDLNSDKMNLQLKNNGSKIQLHIDPAMLRKLQDVRGFIPIIINIQPLVDLQMLLG